ncbi:MAG: transposase [bacterium]|nr:transposase [bacterium]
MPWQAPTTSQAPAQDNQKRQFSKPIAGSLPTIINAYKSSVTRIIRKNHPDMTTPIWHRNYYEHIIRDEIALITIRNYIENNPAVWEQDKFYKA